MAQKYRAVLIGLGNIGYGFEKFNLPFVSTHFEAYQKEARVELVAICDTDEELVKSLAEKYNLKGYVSASVMLQTEQPEIVSICTPDATHTALLELAVGTKSVRGIWCEKPITLSLVEARVAVDNCAAKNSALCVNFVRRYDPFYQTVKEKLPELIGPVQTVTAYYSGGLVTVGSHATDLLDFLFGEPHTVRAFENERGFTAYLEYKNFTVNLVPMKSEAYSIFEFDFFGEKGRLNTINKPFGEYDYQYIPLEKSPHASTGFIGRTEQSPISRDLPREFMKSALSDLIESVESNRETLSSGKTALKSLELISAIALSAQISAPVTFPLTNSLIILPAPSGDVSVWKKN